MVISMEYPIVFKDVSRCPYCWEKNVVAIDKFDREASTKTMLHSVSHLKCKGCGRSLCIRWVQDKEGGEFTPVASHPDLKGRISEEIVGFFRSNQRDLET